MNTGGWRRGYTKTLALLGHGACAPAALPGVQRGVPQLTARAGLIGHLSRMRQPACGQRLILRNGKELERLAMRGQ